jgi:hypothetical protein
LGWVTYHVVCAVRWMFNIQKPILNKAFAYFVKNAHCPTKGHPRIFFIWLLSDVTRYHTTAAAPRAAAVPTRTWLSAMARWVSKITGKEEFIAGRDLVDGGPA